MLVDLYLAGPPRPRPLRQRDHRARRGGEGLRPDAAGRGPALRRRRRRAHPRRRVLRAAAHLGRVDHRVGLAVRRPGLRHHRRAGRHHRLADRLGGGHPAGPGPRRAGRDVPGQRGHHPVPVLRLRRPGRRLLRVVLVAAGGGHRPHRGGGGHHLHLQLLARADHTSSAARYRSSPGRATWWPRWF
jgi:hypothetical protein